MPVTTCRDAINRVSTHSMLATKDRGSTPPIPHRCQAVSKRRERRPGKAKIAEEAEFMWDK
ncbi:MAG: hypothetical protein AAF471_02350 [Myxococcota bacterium]